KPSAYIVSACNEPTGCLDCRFLAFAGMSGGFVLPQLGLAIDGIVAFASRGFQPGTVTNRDFAASVADQTSLLQHAGRDSDAGAARAQHVRQEFLRQDDNVAADAVLTHQQPSG